MSHFSPRHTTAFLSQDNLVRILGSALYRGEQLQLEAGESFLAGTPLCVIGNKFYKADPVTNWKVVGIASADTLVTFPAVAIMDGAMLLSGLTPETEYFLGTGILSVTVPISGRVIKVGTAITSTDFIVNIQLSTLL